jgi:hypothetical protein
MKYLIIFMALAFTLALLGINVVPVNTENTEYRAYKLCFGVVYAARGPASPEGGNGGGGSGSGGGGTGSGGSSSK